MSEEQARQLMQQLQMLEAYSAELAQREDALVGMLRNATAASDSLRTLKERDSDALVPIGMGAYMPARISSDAKVVLDIGAGVAVEKDIASAASYLEARIKEIDVAIRDNAAKRQEAAARLEDGKGQLGQMMQKPGKDHV
ncbi:MAG: prefoldin subunit alpha [Nitrosopumilus sp. H8]|nr:MAG: prefoldin subunit alpha [Nitrosopumilus sp. H8]RNJ78209.1 MAG: prefoldin subunit alpha [Nitrosopumilus sp. H13]